MTLRTNLLMIGVAGLGLVFGVAMAISMVEVWNYSLPKSPAMKAGWAQGQPLAPKESQPWQKTVEQRLRTFENPKSSEHHSHTENAQQDFGNTAYEDQSSSRSTETPDPNEDWHKIQTEWQTKLQLHNTEARNKEWAATTEVRLLKGLEKLASSVKFKLESVDCRTLTCTAQTRWPTRDAAKIGLGALLGHDYQEDCGVEMILTEAPQEGGSYPAILLVNCS